MLEAGLSIYRFSLRERRRQGFINLSHRYFGGGDFLDLINSEFKEYCSVVEAQEDEVRRDENDLQRKILNVQDVFSYNTEQMGGRDYYKYIVLRVEYGESGIRARLMDIRGTHDDPDFVQEPYHAPMKTFHVMLAMPCGTATEYGLLICQRIQGDGVKTEITRRINKFFRHQNFSCVFQASPIASEEHFMRLLRGASLDSLRLIKYYENDHADGMYVAQDQRVIKLVNDERFRGLVRSIFRTNTIRGTGIGVIDGFNPDLARLDVIIRGRKKTVALESVERLGFTEYYTTEDGVVFDDGNMPTSDSLVRVMHRTVHDYIDVVYRENR